MRALQIGPWIRNPSSSRTIYPRSPGRIADAGVVGMLGHEVGDSIHDHRIIVKARKVSDPVVTVKSARHKAQKIVFNRKRLRNN